ncbi:MAG: hypothetical protein AAFN30_05820 [Actinomycetota bacterium]
MSADPIAPPAPDRAQPDAVSPSSSPGSRRPRIGLIANIGTLNEGSLHAALKEHLARPGDEFEVPLDGFVIDIRRGRQLIEIQTTSFAAMGRKLDRILATHPVLIVHPIAVETYLHKPGARPRRSPKRSDRYGLFDELVSMPTLLDHPNLEIEVLLVVVDKHQVADPTLRRNRGGWRTTDRRLREIRDQCRLTTVSDLAQYVPAGLPEVFTTADLARLAPTSRDRAQKLAYCLRDVGLFDLVGRSRRGYEYRLGSGTAGMVGRRTHR